MKKALIISITFSTLLLTTVFYLLLTVRGSGKTNIIQAKQNTTGEKSCCSEIGTDTVSENSIYQLESVWKNETGKKMMLNELKGKKQIMAMVFTSCTYACPLIVNDMKRWHLLTGDENSISELAAVLGFKYKKEPDGSFSHSNIINVLNEAGEVVYQHFGLNQDVQDVLDNFKK